MSHRRLRALCASVLCVATMPALAQDASRVQPRSYRVVVNNPQMRVLEYNAKPGMGVCGTGLHSHPAHLTVLLSPQRVLVHVNGKTFVQQGKVGDAFYEPAVTHEVENISGAPARSLIIEVKQGSGR